MSAMTDFMESGILASMFRGNPDSFTFPPTGIYIGLTSNSPSDADPTANELSGNGYARVQVTQNTSEWTAPADDSGPQKIENSNNIEFPTATANWGYVSGVIVSDAATGGNVYMRGDITTPRDVLSGDTFRFSANDLDIKMA